MAPPQMSDRWLWFTLGIAAFLAFKAIQYTFSDIIALTAIDPQPSIENPSTEEHTDDETISLTTLRTLTSHPNHQIATSARTLIIQKFHSTPNALRDLRREATNPDSIRAKRAQTALKFLEEWSSDDTARGFPPDFEEDNFQGEEGPQEVLYTDLHEMAVEMLRRRPPGAEGEEGINERLTSLAEELGVEGGGEMDFRRLLGDVRVLGVGGDALGRGEEGDDEGHVENARRLGVGNFAGLDGRDVGEGERDRRRARREAVVIRDDRVEREERVRGWWVVR